jgi:hypothetical protein
MHAHGPSSHQNKLKGKHGGFPVIRRVLHVQVACFASVSLLTGRLATRLTARSTLPCSSTNSSDDKSLLRVNVGRCRQMDYKIGDRHCSGSFESALMNSSQCVLLTAIFRERALIMSLALNFTGNSASSLGRRRTVAEWTIMAAKMCGLNA